MNSLRIGANLFFDESSEEIIVEAQYFAGAVEKVKIH
jgi:hypothetical protein